MSTPKIFIIEDEPDLVQALVIRLEAEGYQTACVADGMTAAVRAGEKKPDLILLDICLPGCDGFAVFQELRQQPATKHIPIVFLTARSSVDDRQKARHLGAAEYIVKPFKWHELSRVLHKILAGQQSPAPAKDKVKTQDGADGATS
ncbi:MAG: response regulator [Verrucomicrobia bacterium]|nr:response regulator [Verrucomicrobiota bacterium]MCG2680234.1 response regulator [Kiritimatiellia bacterium]MBU4247673.1 response regulator [Verrucomicrobiota bacterium]MBU4289801.1 response regulator [Verrucomicrobiota bacterium]MBU4428056.1 response regulator [Verrucomicrobiota bacterium]